MPTTVIIAEKNKYIIGALKNTLSCLGFDVVETTSKKFDVEAMASRIKPDLLIYDMHLSSSGKAGLDDLKRLKKQLPKMKILLTSFHETSGQFSTEILNESFDGFWSKFSNRDRLVRKLNVLFPAFSETHFNLSVKTGLAHHARDLNASTTF